MNNPQSIEPVPVHRRIFIAALIGLASMLFCYAMLVRREQMAADFTFSWRSAWYLLHNQNPYQAIQPEGEYPFQTYFFYPLTAAITSTPFTFLPPYLAGALFFGVSSALLAFGISRQDYWKLTIFLSAPYWVALGVAQWSPLICAAILLPGLQWVLLCKPNIGLPGFLYNPTRIGAITSVIFLAISLVIIPTWPFDWLEVLRLLEGHPPPLLILPFGPLLGLAVLRWRSREARLLLGLTVLPQLLFFYDQLPLWLTVRNFKSGLLLSVLSWIAYLGWRLTSLESGSGAILRSPTQYVLALIYLPALAMLFLPVRRTG